MDKAARAALLTAKRKDNASENIADYVADLLRQGRAKEVTDDLMAQADPQRLHQHYTSGNTGMDLPMDQASRMERAKQMGFDSGNKLYHGSVRDFSSFTPSQRGKIGPGVYMTPNERKANIFSGYEPDSNPKIEKLLNEGNEKSSQVYGLFATNRPATMEARQAVRTNESAYDDRAENYRKKFDEMGFDGVSVDDERTILDPTNIRSQFARFDPRLDHLAHLNASKGGAMDFARHVEAVNRAGGQIAPSKYLPNVPRAVHAGGGKVAFMQGNHPDVPDVLYHGNAPKIATKGWTDEVDEEQTQKNRDAMSFHTFKPSEYGSYGAGIYLSDSPKVASDFAQSIRSDQKEPQPFGQVLKLHVSMKQPFTDDTLRHPAWRDYIKDAIKQGLWLGGINDEDKARAAELTKKLDDGTATVRDLFLTDTQHGAMVNQFGQQNIHKTIRNSGFDGIIAHRPDGSKEYVAFKPEQIKSAIGNQGTFDPNDPDITKAGGGRINASKGGNMDLRSKAAEIVRSQPQAKGSVDQLLAMVAGGKGIKQAELLNAGRPFGSNISKEELAKHFEDAVPQVGVTKYGAKSLSDSEKREFQDLGIKHEKGNLFGNEARRFFDLNDKVNGNTQYSENSLPEGENYREHLLHLPKGNREPFYSDHWQEPNVLAHLRMKDRDNGKTLHVEEVQSDWGQKGREQGFYDPMKPIEVFHNGTGQTVHATDDMGEAKAAAEKLGPEYDYGHQGDEKVPQGPYVGNTQQWTDLAIKHALTEAAKGGYERVVFSPGEANADLYNQRTPVSVFQLHKTGVNTGIGMLGAYGHGREGMPPIFKKDVEDEKALKKLVGREHAAKLLAAPSVDEGDGVSTQSISEPDMHLGGHGMVDYYRDYAHASALKHLRQHDPSIKPEDYALPPIQEGNEGYKGFSLPMTETARQSILKNGFEAFKDGGTVGDDDKNPAPVIQNPMSVFPKPQRMFPEDQRPKGGQYISAHNKADVTGHKAETATIGVHPGGKPFFQASQNAVDQTGTVGKGSATTRTNLFKQKAGWKWQDAPEGHEKTDTIVSVEHRGKHFYALNAHFPKGVDLTRYENATSEPRLRPTTQGNVTLGPQAGSISVRGKMHPVYHHVIVKADGGAVDAALALTRRFTKDGMGATMALKPKGK
jgi:hypothetical protein